MTLNLLEVLFGTIPIALLCLKRAHHVASGHLLPQPLVRKYSVLRFTGFSIRVWVRKVLSTVREAVLFGYYHSGVRVQMNLVLAETQSCLRTLC